MPSDGTAIGNGNVITVGLCRAALKTMKLWRQDKGHAAQMRAFVEAIEQGKPSPVPFEEIVEVMGVTLKLAEEHHRPL